MWRRPVHRPRLEALLRKEEEQRPLEQRAPVVRLQMRAQPRAALQQQKKMGALQIEVAPLQMLARPTLTLGLFCPSRKEVHLRRREEEGLNRLKKLKSFWSALSGAVILLYAFARRHL